MKETKLDRALKHMQPWQKEAVICYINTLKDEINDYIRLVTCSMDSVKKYKLLASFIGVNDKNIDTISLDSLGFIGDHRNEAKHRFNFDTLYSTLSAYDMFVLMNKKKPEKLEDLKELAQYFELKKDSSFKELNDDLRRMKERLKNGK